MDNNIYVLELPLKVEKWQEDIMIKRLNLLRVLYNNILHKYELRYNQLIKNKKYREAKTKLYNLDAKKEIKEKIKEIEKKLGKKNAVNDERYISLINELKTISCTLSESDKKIYKDIKTNLEKQFGFTEYGVYGNVNEGIGWNVAQYAKSCGINPTIIQTMCKKNIWKSIEGLLFKGKKIHYKKFNEFNSIYGTNVSKTLTGIGFDGKYVYWRKSGIKNEKGVYSDIVLPINKVINEYEAQALSNEIAYVGIVRKIVRGKNKFYAQLTLKGTLPSKIDKSTNLFRKPAVGRVGLDIGTSTLAIVSDSKVELLELADKAQPNEHKNKIIQRKIDRSIRKNNPNKFNEDGTINLSNRDKWIISKNCQKLKLKLRETYRKLSVVRKLQHEELANHILSLGNECYIETMRWKGLQKRSQNDDVNINGKPKKKKRFGKSIGNRAPSQFMTILSNKLNNYGDKLYLVDTIKCRASQYNHMTKEYNKKSLNERWNVMPNGDKIQRDLYSAFLIQNINDTLNGFNEELLNENYANFKNKHDEEIKRLKSIPNKKLSSMGIK